MDSFTSVLFVAALVLALVLLIDDLVFAPQRRMRAPSEPVAHWIRGLRWVLLILGVLTVRRLFRSNAFDFSLVLVLATAVTGVIWAIESWVLRHRRMALAAQLGRSQADALPMSTSAEYAKSFFPVILIVLLIRSFLFEPFRIPSDSMMPTLLDGDFIFVNKFTYGLRLPVINEKVVSIHDPKRGDVIVFRLPSDPSTNYIKRLVGLPGDHVVVRGRQVFINGELMPMVETGPYHSPLPNPLYDDAIEGKESLTGAEHRVMFIPERTFVTRDFDAVVPAGHYFFMGDNRDNSRDSRYEEVGFVPERNLVGKAVRIWLNLKVWSLTHWTVLWDRIGSAIK
ncbi:MAG TPA: signal peptidase I [Steroidobacteraceae bacterium]|nr:signal peptidase I [Steroidobacteraceae bacterium]